MTAGVLRRHAAKEVRSGTPGSRHGNPCVFAPESTGSVRRTQGRLQRCKDAPSSCQTMRACHQNRKWCKISAASCIGSRALYGLDPDRKKLNEAHGPGRQRGRPVTPTDQIALTAFVEPESYSFARGTFRGKWVARGRSPWSKSSADSPDARQDSGVHRLARQSDTAWSAKSTTKTHVRMCASIRRQEPLRCR